MSAALGAWIADVRRLDPASGTDRAGHVVFRDGQIVYDGEAPPGEALIQGIDAVDGSGHWLMPAAIDLAARFREPGHTRHATFKSETRAALARGIGTIVLPPDTSPVVDTPAIVDRVHRIAGAAGPLRVGVLGALTQRLEGLALAEMSALKAAGCVGVSQGLAPLHDPLIARHALDYARGLGLVVHVFAQDARLAGSGHAHEGATATRLGLPAIPVAAEVSALRLWISLVEDTGGRVHFGRLSSARGVELIESARRRGLPVSADVAAHQLFLTDLDIDGFHALAHVIPPLRAATDRDALRAGVKAGVIGVICSDHQPLDSDAKTNPFPLTEPGISGLDTLLALAFRLIDEGLLTPIEAVRRLTAGPAAVLGRPCPGLAPGERADLVLVNPRAGWTLDTATMLSRGKNSPFLGERFAARAARTWIGGAEAPEPGLRTGTTPAL